MHNAKLVAILEREIRVRFFPELSNDGVRDYRPRRREGIFTENAEPMPIVRQGNNFYLILTDVDNYTNLEQQTQRAYGYYVDEMIIKEPILQQSNFRIMRNEGRMWHDILKQDSPYMEENHQDQEIPYDFDSIWEKRRQYISKENLEGKTEIIVL